LYKGAKNATLLGMEMVVGVSERINIVEGECVILCMLVHILIFNR
jgi:hypothetical protein